MSMTQYIVSFSSNQLQRTQWIFHYLVVLYCSNLYSVAFCCLSFSGECNKGIRSSSRFCQYPLLATNSQETFLHKRHCHTFLSCSPILTWGRYQIGEQSVLEMEYQIQVHVVMMLAKSGNQMINISNLCIFYSCLNLCEIEDSDTRLFPTDFPLEEIQISAKYLNLLREICISRRMLCCQK